MVRRRQAKEDPAPTRPELAAPGLQLLCQNQRRLGLSRPGSDGPAAGGFTPARNFCPQPLAYAVHPGAPTKHGIPSPRARVHGPCAAPKRLTAAGIIDRLFPGS